MKSRNNIKAEIEFKGVELKVEYNYTSAYIGSMYDDNMTGSPSEPAEAEILSLHIKDVDVYYLLEEQLEEIANEIINIEENY